MQQFIVTGVESVSENWRCRCLGGIARLMCCKDGVLSATERRRIVCAGRMHELAFVATEAYVVASRWLNGFLVGAWQAPSISKSSGAVVRHFVSDVDSIRALSPWETLVFDPRCGCVDRKRFRQ